MIFTILGRTTSHTNISIVSALVRKSYFSAFVCSLERPTLDPLASTQTKHSCPCSSRFQTLCGFPASFASEFEDKLLEVDIEYKHKEGGLWVWVTILVTQSRALLNLFWAMLPALAAHHLCCVGENAIDNNMVLVHRHMHLGATDRNTSVHSSAEIMIWETNQKFVCWWGVFFTLRTVPK